MTDAEKLEKIADIEAEIAEINTAVSYIRKGGQSYTITTGSGFGSSRTVTMADYNMLISHRKELQAQLDALEGNRVTRIRAAW